MRIIEVIKDNLSQIAAITEKNIKIHLRFKYSLFFSMFLTPIISIIMPIIILGQFFDLNADFGPWTKDNFMVYIFTSYNILILYGLIASFSAQFSTEKFWGTLEALIIAPFNRFNLLFGIFFSHLCIISFPFIIFFVLCYIYYPISFITILFILIIYLLIALIFSGIGLIIGVFIISNENIAHLIGFALNLIIFTSCISYPYEIFPTIIQNVINLNPLFYAFSFLRFAWIENDIFTTISFHFLNFLFLLLFSISFPAIAVIIFNKIYKKYGITGY